MRILPLFALAASLPVLSQVGNLQLSTTGLSFSTVTGTTLPQSQLFGVTSTGAALPVNVSVRYFSGTEGWLSAVSDSGTTPATVTVTVNPAGLAVGTYIGQVLVVASPTQSGLVTVTLTVTSTTPGGGLISALPSSVTLSGSGGQLVQSTVTLTSVGSVPFQVFVTTTGGGNWLSYIAPSTTAPTSLTIVGATSGLAAGSYTGTVSVVPLNGSPGTAIPVTLIVGGGGGIGGFTVLPTSLTFLYQTGTSLPGSQSVFVNNTDGIVNFVATSAASWLKLTSNTSGFASQTVSGTSGSNLNFFVDPTGLTPGFYTTTVGVTASNGGSQTVGVSLTVSGSSLLIATPSSMVFTYNPDSGVPPSQQTAITASGAPLNFTASASSTGWLFVGPQTGATNGANVLTVSVSPGGLPTGTYTGSVSVVSGSTSLTIPVTLIVSTGTTNAITATPSSLNFQAAPSSPSSSQQILLTAATTKNFVASVSTTGGSWLSISTASGTTPASITVTVNPLAAAGAGVYSGLIHISNLSDGTQFVVPVSMTLSSGALTASPQSLSFSLASGSSTGAGQNIQLSGIVGAVYTAVSDSFWLTVTPNTGALPGVMTLSVSAASLQPGNYSGVVTVTSAGSTVFLTVALTVTAPAGVILSPTLVTFQHTPGTPEPGPRTIAVTSQIGTVAFSVSRTTASGGDWLRVSPSGTSTPASLTLTVQPAGLTAGTYRGTITVTSLVNGDTRTAEVTLTVTAPARPVLRTALHGAMRQLSAITPGMILSLEGRGLGPVGGAQGTILAAGAYETSLQGYRALFEGVPAPILYASEGRMDVVAPYSIAGKRGTRVVVENAGGSSDPLDLFVSPDAAPGIFSLDTSGRGQAAALNENGTVNGPDNRAAAGSVLVFYATGEGQTRPAGQDGRIIATDLRVPVLPVAVNIGGEPAEVLYAGSAPGMVSGVIQVNVRLPATVARGPAVALELRVGPAPSQPGITVAIR